MTKKIKISELKEFDMAEYLTNDEEIAEYLSIVIEENDPSELARALWTIARARGMTDIAAKTGITREALYKALRADAKPRFETIQKVCGALGFRLKAEPVGHH